MRVRCMITPIFVLGLLIGFFRMENIGMGSNPIQSGGQHSHVFEKTVTKTVSCRYLLYLPGDYGKQGRLWPMILFLHGAGERGDDLELVKKHGPPKLIDQGRDFPFIIVSPQCPDGDWWPEKTDTLITLLDEIVADYHVDHERIYLTGLSMGGYGTWALAWRYPQRFAAIAPICGGGYRFMADRLKDVPIWAFHGAKDNIVPLSESEAIVNAVNGNGGNAILTVYPDAYHDSWTKTYDNTELYDWFLKHRKTEKTK